MAPSCGVASTDGFLLHPSVEDSDEASPHRERGLPLRNGPRRERELRRLIAALVGAALVAVALAALATRFGEASDLQVHSRQGMSIRGWKGHLTMLDAEYANSAGQLGSAAAVGCAELGCSGYDPSRPCQCNFECQSHSSCCADYANTCGTYTSAAVASTDSGSAGLAPTPSSSASSGTYTSAGATSGYSGGAAQQTPILAPTPGSSAGSGTYTSAGATSGYASSAAQQQMAPSGSVVAGASNTSRGGWACYKYDEEHGECDDWCKVVGTAMNDGYEYRLFEAPSTCGDGTCHCCVRSAGQQQSESGSSSSGGGKPASNAQALAGQSSSVYSGSSDTGSSSSAASSYGEYGAGGRPTPAPGGYSSPGGSPSAEPSSSSSSTAGYPFDGSFSGSATGNLVPSPSGLSLSNSSARSSSINSPGNRADKGAAVASSRSGGDSSQRHTFYMYRAQDETDYPVENLNLADLAGVLWYLHNEVVVTCPRKFDISRIRRFRVTMQNTQALRDRIHSVFAPFMAFDSGRCTVPDADNVWQTDGFVVGCQIQRLEMGNYRSPVKTAKRCDRVEDDCYGPVWYSLPGRCPSQYYDGKTPQCTQNQPGGACANKKFTRADGGECTYFVEDAGEIELDQLTGIVGRYTDFCASGAREYVEGLDQGVSMTFWDNKTNEEACVNRMMAVQSAFHARYPNMPAHIDSPLCDA